MEAKIISGGSTPACDQSHHISQYTEIRPGTNIYNDTNMAWAGFAQFDHCAASILATAVSTAVPNQCVVDAGNKTLISDRCFMDPSTGALETSPACRD